MSVMVGTDREPVKLAGVTWRAKESASKATGALSPACATWPESMMRSNIRYSISTAWVSSPASRVMESGALEATMLGVKAHSRSFWLGVCSPDLMPQPGRAQPGADVGIGFAHARLLQAATAKLPLFSLTW